MLQYKDKFVKKLKLVYTQGDRIYGPLSQSIYAKGKKFTIIGFPHVNLMNTIDIYL